MNGFLDQQGGVVASMVKDPCFFPEGLVVLRPHRVVIPGNLYFR